jgi:hypothetical protein
LTFNAPLDSQSGSKNTALQFCIDERCVPETCVDVLASSGVSISFSFMEQQGSDLVILIAANCPASMPCIIVDRN